MDICDEVVRREPTISSAFYAFEETVCQVTIWEADYQNGALVKQRRILLADMQTGAINH